MTEGARQGYAEIDWRQRKTDRERKRERARERKTERNTGALLRFTLL